MSSALACPCGQASLLPASGNERFAYVRPPLVQHALDLLQTEVRGSQALSSPAAVRDYLRLLLADRPYEVFCVVFLDSQHRVLDVLEMFRGTLTQTSVYPREILVEALARNTAAVILAHNHPSGHAEPSPADQHLTQTAKSALSLVDIRVLDHFVVTRGELVSFAERGLI